MSDDAHLWNHRPPPRVPRPGEPLWSLRKDHITWSAELHFRGESYGWEVQILRDGELVMGRRFILREGAARWGEAERNRIERGWTDNE